MQLDPARATVTLGKSEEENSGGVKESRGTTSIRYSAKHRTITSAMVVVASHSERIVTKMVLALVPNR